MTIRSLALVTALAALAIVTVSCRDRESIPPQAIARVGSRYVTIDDFKRYLERNAGTDLAQMAPQVSSAMLDQLLEELLLSEHAAIKGVEIPADRIAAAVRNDPGATAAEKRDELRRTRLLADASLQIATPTPEEVRQFYLQHPQDFRSEEEVWVRQILVRDEKLADQILEQLRRGASFDALSEKHSTASNASRGGEIGYVSRGELPKIFEDEIFSMTAGGRSRIIRTDSGFHIFKLEDRRPAGVIELEAAAPAIRARMRDDAMRRQLEEMVAVAKREIPLTILTKRLSFPYSGNLPRSKNE